MSRALLVKATCIAGVLVGLQLVGPSGSAFAGNSLADKIFIEKAERRLTLFSGERAIKVYAIALGRNPVGRKIKRGDGRTPEGIYTVDYRNLQSRYHLALHISYPNPADKARARHLGVDPGGDITIHGIRRGFGWAGSLHRLFDWTDGCIAVTNAEVEEISRLVPDGIEVEIQP